MLKWVRFYFLLIITVCISAAAQATHLRAGDITVVRQCNSNRYAIILHVYVRTNVPTKFSVADAGTLDFGDGSPVFHPAEVDNPPIIGMSDNGPIGEVIDTVYHTYSGSGLYTITYSEPNRNEGILNISGSINVTFFIQTQIRIDPFLGCDNSPELLVPPIDQGCTGVKWTHNPGAYDPDGDSLSYSMTVPKWSDVVDNYGRYVSSIDVPGYALPNSQQYYSGLTYTQANEAGNGSPKFSIDPITGTVTWDAPGEAGEYNIAFIIQEWRKINGVWISLGYVERDMQIVIQDCNNKRPQLQVPQDLCVQAGTLITEQIFATDPDGSASGGANKRGDSVVIQGYSQIFNLTTSKATYTPGPAVWQPTFSPTDQAKVTFNWQTTCNNIAQQPYQVTFKATDNGAPPLATFETWRITVIAPAPQWNAITLNANQRAATLNWNAYTCAHTADSMQIWRRVDSNPYTPPPCVTGIPASLGYVKIAEVPIGTTTFIDKHLAAGAEYCYRLVAVFASENGGSDYPSVVSTEYCIPPIIADRPVVTNVTIDSTDTEHGQITIKWRPPFEVSAAQFPPPYSYVVERADGYSGNINLSAPLNPGKQPDTTFVDTGLNTYANVYNYRIIAYDNTGSVIDTSATASSVRLDLKLNSTSIELNWTADVPWSNNIVEYPWQWHLIYRGTNSSSEMVKDLTLIDSINVNQYQFAYVDSGQYQHTPLVKGQNYCYAVMTRGSYGNPKIKTPLNNFSEITCGTTDDKTPPCAPVLSVTGIDCDNYSACTVIGAGAVNTYNNTITWSVPTGTNCKNDIRYYKIYTASQEGGTFALDTTVVDTTYTQHNLPSFAMCYKVSAVDRAGNESALSDEFCFDNCPYYELPNVFTPNGDGCNDKFSAYNVRYYGEGGWPCGSTISNPTDSAHYANTKAKCARFVKNVGFAVYNRWGKQVYTYDGSSLDPDGSAGIYIDWNGKDNNGQDLDAAVYYYIARVVFDTVDPKKRNKTLKGWVQIIR